MLHFYNTGIKLTLNTTKITITVCLMYIRFTLRMNVVNYILKLKLIVWYSIILRMLSDISLVVVVLWG